MPGSCISEAQCSRPFPAAELQSTPSMQSEAQQMSAGDETVWLFHYTNLSLCRLISNIRKTLYQSQLHPWAACDIKTLLEVASGFEGQLLG